MSILNTHRKFNFPIFGFSETDKNTILSAALFIFGSFNDAKISI